MLRKKKPMTALLNYLLPVRKRLGRILPDWCLAILKSLCAGYSFRRSKPRVVRHRYGTYDFQLQLVDYDGESWFDRDYDDGAFAETVLLKQHNWSRMQKYSMLEPMPAGNVEAHVPDCFVEVHLQMGLERLVG